MEINVKYPCGYEAHLKAGLFDIVIGDIDKNKGCPLHGMNCKKK